MPVNCAESLPLVGDRVSAAHRRPLGIAEQRSQPAALHVGPPGDADVGRDVVPVGVVAAVAGRELLEHRHLAAARARARRSCRRCSVPPSPMPEMPQTDREAGDRHRVVERRERRLHVPANAGVHREGRRHAPRVLDERRVVVQLPVPAAFAEERVLVGVRIERRLPGDRARRGRSAARRAARASVELSGRGAREVRRVEQACRGIVGRVEPEIDPGHHLLRVVPGAAEERDAAEA